MFIKYPKKEKDSTESCIPLSLCLSYCILKQTTRNQTPMQSSCSLNSLLSFKSLSLNELLRKPVIKNIESGIPAEVHYPQSGSIMIGQGMQRRFSKQGHRHPLFITNHSNLHRYTRAACQVNHDSPFCFFCRME